MDYTRLTEEQMIKAREIPAALHKKYLDLEGEDLIHAIYNEAIEDAANFARDLAPHNRREAWAPQVLKLVATEIDTWLTIPPRLRESG